MEPAVEIAAQIPAAHFPQFEGRRRGPRGGAPRELERSEGKAGRRARIRAKTTGGRGAPAPRFPRCAEATFRAG